MTDTIQSYDPSVNLLQALLWQYNEASRLQSLAVEKQAWYDGNQASFWSSFYTDIYNLKTANDFGLAIWSILLGQPISFSNIGNPNKINFGFGTPHRNFTRGNFVSNSGYNYVLSTETARILLQLRYFQLTTAGTIPEVNRMLKYVFADMGAAFLLDGNDMTQTYVFIFELNSELKFLFNNYDILPRPAGVGSTYRIEVYESWGFGQYHENFSHGNFSEG